MPIGVIVNCLSVVIGGVFGALLKNRVNQEFCGRLTQMFGVCSMTIGVYGIISMQNLPPVILSVVIGTILGEWARLENRIAFLARKGQMGVAKLLKRQHDAQDEEEMLRLVSIIVLFCASGTGIFGSLQAGMTGDHTILYAKSILDLFTAGIFAVSLGYVVSAIAVPQFLIMGGLFLLSTEIMPLVTPSMLGDFTACGGVLILATGFRVSEIKNFPIASMLPAMLLVMPVSWLWTELM